MATMQIDRRHARVDLILIMIPKAPYAWFSSNRNSRFYVIQPH